MTLKHHGISKGRLPIAPGARATARNETNGTVCNALSERTLICALELDVVQPVAVAFADYAVAGGDCFGENSKMGPRAVGASPRSASRASSLAPAGNTDGSSFAVGVCASARVTSQQ
jgi:hypothetical protein